VVPILLQLEKTGFENKGPLDSDLVKNYMENKWPNNHYRVSKLSTMYLCCSAVSTGEAKLLEVSANHCV
jgi:hypothetical protein